MPKLTSRLPGSVAALLHIEPGEKVIAWGSSPGDDPTQTVFTVATDHALYVQVLEQRIPWDRITKATWDDPLLEVVVVDDGGRARPPARITIEAARDLPAAVHDRVTASVVVNERVDLGGGAKALLVARRGSDGDAVRWSVVFDAGVDAGDPAVRAAADEALARLRDSLGI